MNKKNNKVMVWLMLVMFITVTFLGIFGQFSAKNVHAAELESEKKEDKVYKFSIEEAIAFAKTNNYDMLTMKLQSSELTYGIRKIREERSNYNSSIRDMMDNNMSVSSLSNVQSFLLKNKYTENIQNDNKKLSEKSNKVQEDLLNIFVESSYNSVLINKAKSEDAKRNYELIKNQTENGKIKLSLGTISEIQYKQLEMQQNNAEIAMLQANNNYEIAKMNFNEKLGLELTDKVELTSELKITEKTVTETEEKDKLIKENSLTLMAEQNAYKSSQEYSRLMAAYYGEKDENAKIAKLQAEESAIALKSAEKDFEKSLKQTYMNIEVLSKNVKLLQQQVEIMKTMLGLTNIRKEIGMATENDVISASIEYNNTLYTYYETLDKYNQLVGMFEVNVIG